MSSLTAENIAAFFRSMNGTAKPANYISFNGKTYKRGTQEFDKLIRMLSLAYGSKKHRK